MHQLTGKTNCSNFRISRIVLWSLLLAITFTETISVQRRIDCRKFVHAPICRGIAAKRDTQAHTEDVRYGQTTEDSDYFMDNNSPKIVSNENNQLANLNGLWALLRKSALKNLEYDTGTGTFNNNNI